MSTSRWLSGMLVICGLVAQNLAAQTAPVQRSQPEHGELVASFSRQDALDQSRESRPVKRARAAWQPWERALKRPAIWARAGRYLPP